MAKSKARAPDESRPPKRPVGHPPAVINPKQLEALASIFCTKEEAASVLGIGSKALYRALAERPGLAEVWNNGAQKARASLRRKQMTLADRFPAMAIWLGKVHLKQKDVTAHELSGPGGGPVRTEASPEDRALIREVVREIAADRSGGHQGVVAVAEGSPTKAD